MASLAAIAATAAASAGTAGTAAVAGTSLLSQASLAVGALSAGASIVGGLQQQQQYDLSAKSIELQGRREAIANKEQLMRTMSSNYVAAAASGISGATIERTQESSIQATHFSNAELKSASKLKGNQTRMQGKQAAIGGVVRGVSTLFDTVDDYSVRRA